MKRVLLFLSVSFSLLPSTIYTHAAVISRDWKNPGDGLLTYDTVNKREWLDIPVSLLSQFHPTDADLATDIALVELLPGGLFEGFTFATRDDVVGLVNSATPLTPDSSYFFRGNATLMAELVQLLGPYRSSEVGIATYAVINEITTPPSRVFDKYYQANLYVSGGNLIIPNGHGLLGFGNSDDYHASPFLGMMLYRNAVPEPSGIFSFIVANLFALPHRQGSRQSER